MQRKYKKLELKPNKKSPRKKKKLSLNDNYRSIEILMPQDLIERYFDSSMQIGFETDEQEHIRLQQEAYNKEIVDSIKKIRFTKKQSTVLELMFNNNMTLTDICEVMGTSVQNIEFIKKQAFAKIRKKVKYKFKYTPS